MVVSGQITIDNTDMPEPGDTIRTSITSNFSGVDFSLTGQDYLWDFSDLEPLAQDVDTFVSVEQTPFLYRVVFQFQTNANLAQKASEITAIPDMEITEPYLYYSNLDEYYANEGIAFTLNSIPFPVNFSSPDVIYEFPLLYGKEYNSRATFDFLIPGLAYVSVDRQRTNIVDGWGTVVTPYGSFEALRVYSMIEEYDSIYIDSLGMGFPVSREVEEYKWLANDMGLPVITVTEDGLTSTISFIDSLRLPGQVHEQHLISSCKVYPNPCTDQLRVSMALMEKSLVRICLYSKDGRLFRQMVEGTFSQGESTIAFDMNENRLNPGVYILQISAEGHCVTRKVILQR
jgi:hypothetical protein